MPPHPTPSELAPPQGCAPGDRVRIGVAVALAAGLLLWGAAQAWPFFADDAFISLRYADRLLHGHGLTWNDGERVEGYSNLLWTLLCAGLGALGLDLVVAARALGIAAALAVAALLAHRYRRTWPGALAAAAFAAAPSTPIWAIGGLELPLVWLAVTAGLLQCERAFAAERPQAALLRAGGWLAAACLTRPDAPLFAALAGLAALLAFAPRGGRAAGQALAALGALPLAALLGQLAFRLAYYGDFVPNTARIKLAGGDSADLWRGGLVYLRIALPAFAPLLLAALPGAVHAVRARRPYAFLLLVCACAWPLYVAQVGGDIFPGWRLLSPLLVPTALLAGLTGERWAQQPGRAPLAALALALAAVGGGRLAAAFDPETQRAAQERFEWDYLALGRALGASFAREQPLFAVQAAGALCYASRLPSLDMFGLNDAAIARQRHATVADGEGGAFGAAHRRGSADYLAARAPDLISFDERIAPEDREGRAWTDAPAFVRDHRCVLVRAAAQRQHGATAGQELVLPLWFRTTGRIGVATTAEAVRVPACLLGALAHAPGRRYPRPDAPPEQLAAFAQANPEVFDWWTRRAVATPGPQGLQLEVRRPGPCRFGPFPLTEGSWALHLLPATPGCTARLERSGAEATLVLDVGPDAALPLRLDAVELRRGPR